MPFTAGLVEVIIYSSPDDKKKNRGFCFLEYESHKAASLAKRRLGTGRIKVILLGNFLDKCKCPFCKIECTIFVVVHFVFFFFGYDSGLGL